MGEDQRFITVEVIDDPLIMRQPEILKSLDAVVVVAPYKDPDVRTDPSDPLKKQIRSLAVWRGSGFCCFGAEKFSLRRIVSQLMDMSCAMMRL